MTQLQPGVDLYKAQLELEEWCGQIGRDKALRKGWEKGARGCLINRLASLYWEAVRATYKRGKTAPGKQAHVWRLMHDEKQLKHVAMEVFVWLLSNMQGNKRYNALAAAIGRRAEYALWLKHPAWGKSWHLRGLKLVGGGEMGMEDLIKKVTSKNLDLAKAYHPLEQGERIALGSVFLEMFQASTQLIEFYVEKRAKRQAKMVRHTDTFFDFLDRYKDALGAFRVAKLPMLIEPRPWAGFDDGGYLTIRLPVSTVDRVSWPILSKHMHRCVLGSINHLQSQALVLDHDQAHILRECWELGHEMGSLPSRIRHDWPNYEGERDKAFYQQLWKTKADRRKDGARCAVVSSIVSYERLKDADRLFFAWTMDARGRIYANGAQINVQGPDHFRTLLQFEQTAPIKGHMRQLSYALAQAFGVKENVGTWLHDNRDWLVRCGLNPMDNLGQLQAAKEPWRFLQLCRDLAGFVSDPSYESGTIHWRDQCCSGWGHVACLTGDEDLARRTNVIGKEKQDLYQSLGNHCLIDVARLLESEKGNEARCAAWWLDHWPSRKLWKQAAMPLIYGRSYMSMVEEVEIHLRDEIQDFLTDQGLRITELARVLSSSLFRVARQQLPNLRDLAAWLATGTKAQIQKGVKPCFYTPNGMQVQSFGSSTTYESIQLLLSNRAVQISTSTNKGGKPDLAKTRRRFSPDYIHSYDSAFLLRFVDHWACFKHPIQVVHDCFGTTIDHVDTMHRELLDQFARFHSVDHLAEHHRFICGTTGFEMDAPPIVGTLNRNKVGSNPHLFS